MALLFWIVAVLVFLLFVFLIWKVTKFTFKVGLAIILIAVLFLLARYFNLIG